MRATAPIDDGTGAWDGDAKALFEERLITERDEYKGSGEEYERQQKDDERSNCWSIAYWNIGKFQVNGVTRYLPPLAGGCRGFFALTVNAGVTRPMAYMNSGVSHFVLHQEDCRSVSVALMHSQLTLVA